MRIATWNVNSLKARLAHLRRWLAELQPDVVALQETKAQDADLPVGPIRELGYSIVLSGQRSYNGVATLSRGEVAGDAALATSSRGIDDPPWRLLRTRHGEVTVVNVYVPNGASPDSDKYDTSWRGCAA